VVLRHFTGAGGDGSGPVALVEGSEGVLYGTTHRAGQVSAAADNFQAEREWERLRGATQFSTAAETRLLHPPLSVTQGSDGALYGTTSTGNSWRHKQRRSGIQAEEGRERLRVLHLFTNINDGYDAANLIQGNDGALYGTAWSGGSNNSGTVFRLNRDGSAFTVLHSYSGGNSDGSDPRAGLLEASDNALTVRPSVAAPMTTEQSSN